MIEKLPRPADVRDDPCYYETLPTSALIEKAKENPTAALAVALAQRMTRNQVFR